MPRQFKQFMSVAMVAVILGSLGLAEHATAQDTTSLPIRGVLRAINVASISTDLAVPIKQMPFRAGAAFKKGQTLVKFDCARFYAARAALVAERKIQSLTYKNNVTLLKHRAIGEYDVEISKAKVGKANAEIAKLDVRIADCEVKAPFDGHVEQVLVRRLETPKTGTPFIKISESGQLEVELIVPSKWLVWLHKGSKFTFSVDETGRKYKGEIVRLGASVDAVSQTVQVTGTITARHKGIFAGMSGSAKFSRSGS